MERSLTRAVKYRLEVSRCPAHPTFWAICLNDEHGGLRLTGSKCCGQWGGVSRDSGRPAQHGPFVEWPINARELARLAEDFTHAAKLAAKHEDEYLAGEKERGQ